LVVSPDAGDGYDEHTNTGAPSGAGGGVGLFDALDEDYRYGHVVFQMP
jgi:hypothetical protein